jgi:hypothetical protein
LLLPGLVTYTKDQCERSNGKLRGGEANGGSREAPRRTPEPPHSTPVAPRASSGAANASREPPDGTQEELGPSL